MKPKNNRHEDSQSVSLLTVKEISQMMGISTRTLHRWNVSGQMPSSVKIGGCVRWKKREIESWIESGGEIS